MMQRTLLFPSLGNLAHFAREYGSTYRINTCNLTLTGPLTDELVAVAGTVFGASLIATTEKVFSYDPIPARPLQPAQSV
ncbi:MAG TPA: hypothetical protein VGN63_12760 [Flavisolibacter sp.]|jgi:hypothetical protein|nr:hypothetical protein [Flavisolibacter sp.]